MTHHMIHQIVEVRITMNFYLVLNTRLCETMLFLKLLKSTVQMLLRLGRGGGMRG